MFAQKIINWIIPMDEVDDDTTDIDDAEIETPEHHERCDSITLDAGDVSCEDDTVSAPGSDTATAIFPFNLEPELTPDNDEIQIRETQMMEKGRIHSHCEGDKTRQGEIHFNQPKIPVLYSRNAVPNSVSTLPTIPASDARKGITRAQPFAVVYTLDGMSEPLKQQTVTENKKQRDTFTQTERNSPRRDFDAVCTPSAETQIQILPIIDSIADKNNSFPEMHLFNKAPTQSDSVTKNTPMECDVYGELLVLGCNGSVPDHLANHMGNRFVLKKRFRSNGVKEAPHSVVTSRSYPMCHSPTEHRIFFSVSGSRSVVVEYVQDKGMDMFQIGRFESSPVDFRVLDVNTRDKARNGVSRFACRILVQRHGNHEARVFAAAFDAAGNIFLGDGAQTCTREGKMDGFTTNGVLILNPKTNPYHWREVSVCGHVYPIRSTHADICKRPRALGESNILLDGTLIDLCGVTLLWRTPDGMRDTPSEDCLRRFEPMIRNLVPKCHMLQEMPDLQIENREVRAFVFLSCGHVLAMDVCEFSKGLEGWRCPICRCTGPITKLNVGRERGFYVDRDVPSHAFRPCGHVATFKTVQYWSSMQVLDHRNIQSGFCPFCGTKLSSITKYIELIYP